VQHCDVCLSIGPRHRAAAEPRPAKRESGQENPRRSAAGKMGMALRPHAPAFNERDGGLILYSGSHPRADGTNLSTWIALGMERRVLLFKETRRFARSRDK